MAWFRKTDPRPAPPSDDQILTTLAAAMLMAEVTHDGAVLLEPEAEVALINAQAEAMRRGLL